EPEGTVLHGQFRARRHSRTVQADRRQGRPDGRLRRGAAPGPVVRNERAVQNHHDGPERAGGAGRTGGGAVSSVFRNAMSLQFPSLSENESFARVAVAAFVSQLDPTLDELMDIKTVVSEAVTNAIIHG